MIRFTKDGKVDRDWVETHTGRIIPKANSYSNLADALDVAVAALRSIAHADYRGNRSTESTDAFKALRQLGVEHD